MSDSIFRIWSIARYEAKVIMRGWLYRAGLLLPVSFLLVIMFTRFFNSRFIGFLIQVFYNAPSTTSWMVTIFYTIYGCLILSAVTIGSEWREQKNDSQEAIRVRPWTNIEYAVARGAGQVFCFIVMTAAVILVTIGIAVFSPGLIVILSGYLIYPLIICIPAFLFVSGLSMLAVRLLRNQMLSLLSVTAIILILVFSADRFFHLFDMTSFRMPLFYSSMTGFSFPELIIRQRLMFLNAGLAMIFLSALISIRPPGRRLVLVAVSMITVIFISVALIAGHGYLDHFLTGIEIRKEMREASSRVRPLPRLLPHEYSIEVDQNGKSVDCVATVVLENSTGSNIDRYILTLNPGFDILGTSIGSDPVEFKRSTHLVTVMPESALEPGERDTVTVRYSGRADQRAMYSDVPEEVRCSDLTFKDMSGLPLDIAAMRMVHVPRELAPARDDYILLVPDAMWYPIPLLPYDQRHPDEDMRPFSRFRLRVKTQAGLNPVSQGERSETERGTYTFEPEYPLTGLTLAIGKFRERIVEVDSISYNLYSVPESEGVIRMIRSVSDTLPSLIADRKDIFEYSIGLEYPFRRMIFLEVPTTFFPFVRPMRETGYGLAQPEIFLFHEGGMTLGLGGLPAWISMEEKYMSRKDLSVEEINKRTVVRSISFLLSSMGSNSVYNIFPMYFRHVTGLEPAHNPYLWLLFENMAGEGAFYNQASRRWSKDGITGNERASRLVSSGELKDYIADGCDFTTAGILVMSWAYHHHYLIEALSDGKTVSGFIREVIDSNRFRTMNEDEFILSFSRYFGFDLETTVIDLDDPVEVPGYLYGNYDCCEMKDGERTYYRAGFDIVNREGIRGVVAVSTALKYPKAVRKAMKRTIKSPIAAVVALEPGESRRIEFDLDYRPISIWINTMISRNIPSRIKWGPRVEISGLCNGRRRKHVGMDLGDFNDGSIIVDDQDDGFETSGGEADGFLKRILGTGADEREYTKLNNFAREGPASWKSALHDGFFGAYIRSAKCIRAGTGDAKATWKANIEEAGSYEIFCHIIDPFRKGKQKSRAKMGVERMEHRYTIRHADGSSEVILKPSLCEDGWNLIGRYYFDEGEAVVELSDESPVFFVIADAVKWVKKD